MSDLEANKRLVKEFFDCLGTFDAERLMKVLDPSITFNVPNIGCLGGKLTLADLPMVASILTAACPDGLRFEILDLTAEDDRVAARVDGFAKVAGGGEYNNRYHFLFNIRNGRICRTFEYMDSLLVENVLAERTRQYRAGKSG